jgi:ribosomal-protein-alanine N-acetyltransferase
MASAPRAVIPKLADLPLNLETSRLRLRLLAERDVEDLWPTVSDPAFPLHMTWGPHHDREETRAFVQSVTRAHAENTGVTWAIEHDGRAIGCIGLDGIVWQLRAIRVDRAELGYWLQKSSWGEGLMTEAATAVLRCAFETIGLHKVKCGALAANLGSQRVIEKLGFRLVGKQEDDVWRDGRWHDHLRYEMTARDYPDVHTTMRVKRP